MFNFTTETGSKYQVNPEEKLIRRLSGNSSPTSHQGSDGEWKQYEGISDVVVGKAVFISWPPNTPLLPGSPSFAIPITHTSYVVEISQE